MAVEIGSRLGPYEVLARLGAGGMGEVYRARDSRLGRDVAIKLLPDAFADDPERLARFEREAKLLASLQHASIAVLHGLEEAQGRRFLVMQCVEGESLAQRLARGALPVPEALEIASAIAAALEAAHESGIVHRDLKPGNVMVTPAGEVKVLDFGLAKGGAGASNSDVGLSASPTRTHAATSAGVILGTAAYMSPEQARGKPVDRRADIWSFGCVLYEMLAGRQAFAGETVSDIVAHILQSEPDWSCLPAPTPARVRELLARCLQKDARRRLRDIGDARLELEDVIAGRVPAGGESAPSATGNAPRRAWLAPALAALALAAVAAAWLAGRRGSRHDDDSLARFTVGVAEHHVIVGDAVAQAISPDGRLLAMIATDSAGVSHLWVRPMDATTPRMLPGTANVTLMFWSPDSRSLGFFANDRQLSRVSIGGGEPQPICEVKTARGGSWGEDGTILVAPYSAGAICRVPARGGDLVPVVRPDSAHGETALRFPMFLPDGKHFLFVGLPADSVGRVRVHVGALDGSRRELLRADGRPDYVAPGWLVFGRRSDLLAQRFDAGAAKLVGDALPLGDIAGSSQFLGAPIVTASRTGTLAYVTNDPAPVAPAWVDRASGAMTMLPVPAGPYAIAAASPDGRHALLASFDRNRNEFLSLADLERGIVTQVTPTEENASYPVWAPDGVRFAFMQDHGSEPLVLRSTADDSKRVLLASDPGFKRTDSWSSDGRWLVYDRLDPASKWDVWRLPLEGGAPEPLVHTAADERFAQLSPDDRWVAYQSDVSGEPQVYVAPFGATGGRYQVSTRGGVTPFWSRDGRTLFFVDLNSSNTILSADRVPGGPLAFGPVRTQLRVPDGVVAIDTGPVGRRLLVLAPGGKPRAQTITIVQNWTAALHRP